MGTLKSFSFAGVIALGFASSASAADMLFPPDMPGAARPGFVELGTGWYLRGDVGYVDYDQFRSDRDRARVAFAETLPERTWSAGGGFGYKFTNLLRADVTVDYRFGSDFESVSSLTGFVDDSRTEWGKFETTTALVNAYLDLGTWSGVTPYIGAGVGGALHRFHEFRTQVTCLTLACGAALGPQTAVLVRAHSRTELAWALMAGVAVDVAPGLKVDVGYRYANLGEAEMRLAPGATAVRTKDLEAHEVRVGLRYMIDQP
jgi:opacity protein-like surface antigen